MNSKTGRTAPKVSPISLMTTTRQHNVMRQDHHQHAASSQNIKRNNNLANSETLAQDTRAKVGALDESASGSLPLLMQSGVGASIKWSHHIVQVHRLRSKMKRSISCAGAAWRLTRLDARHHSNLILSIIIGLLLAAVHSDAFSAANTSNNNLQSSAHSPPTGQNNGSASSSSSSSSTSKPTGVALLQDASPSINLIPVDQPVSLQPASSSALRAAKLQDLLAAVGSPEVSSRSAGSAASPASPSSGRSNESSSASLMSDDALPASSSSGGQPQDDDFSEPQAQAHYNAAAVEAPFEQQQYQQIVEQQAEVKSEPAPIKQQQQQYFQKPVDSYRQLQQQQQQSLAGQSVERRFGLFKKGQQQHYGAPAMSASYSNPFAMSDCERCLAGFGQSGASADLQQLEPVLPAPPATLPLQPAIQVPPSSGPAGGHFGTMQPFGPLKSKFFMKFPFFVKPMGSFDGHSGGYAGQTGGHFWPAPQLPQSSFHHQTPASVRPSPAMSSALYIRPAPSYNCIQANPPLLAASASSQSQTSEPIPLGATKSAGSKQYAHQQVSSY